MLKIVVLVLLAIVSINTYKIPCECGENQAFDFPKWQCVDYPTEISQGQIYHCINYSVYNGRFICNQCESQYLLETYKDHFQQCLYTYVKHCKIVQSYQESIEVEPVYSCKECDEGYYLDDLNNCVKLFEPDNKNYIQNCKEYYQYAGEFFYTCTECKEGYYLSKYGDKCIKYPTDSVCSKFDTYKYGLMCKECKEPYLIDQFQKCILPSTVIPNCFNGYYNQQSSQYYCDECNDGFYASQDNRKCLQNPQYGQNGYIEHCKTYRFDHNNLTCYYCQEQTYFVAEDGKQCQKLNKSSIVENCEFYLEADGILGCDVCQNGYHQDSIYWGSFSCRQCPNNNKNISEEIQF